MKTRILAIVPYNGMKEILNNIAAENGDLEFNIHTANLQKGLEIVQSCNLDNFDVIIARGGTAELIAKHVLMPVVQIGISVYDILRAIRLAQNYTSHFAIVGTSVTTESAQLLSNLMQYNLQIITLDNYAQDREAIQKLQVQGCEMVLCDMSSSLTAYELGMNYILITSGRETIESAIKQAVNTAQLYSHCRKQTKLFKAAFAENNESLFVYDYSRTLVSSSISRNADTEIYFRIIEQNIESFASNNAFHLEEQANKKLLSFRCRHVMIDQISYIFVYMRHRAEPIPPDVPDNALYIKKENSLSDSSLYGNANLVGATRQIMEAYSKTLLPVLILGEINTGKDGAASFIRSHGEYKKQHYIVIDCENTKSQKWNYFMENPNSPFNDIHITIYIKNFQALPETVSDKLLPYLHQNDLCRRNRFIFSYTLTNEADINHPVCQYLLNRLSCMMLHLPPLRNRTEDLPSIATLYISQANIELGKQVVGFEPEAMALIQNFDWPHNLAQFSRIIHQLITITDSDYIPADLLRQILKQETPPQGATPLRSGYEAINTNQSLEKINSDIVHIVLNQENMNRSKAAERLKISRTTLWRMLQK